MTKQKHRTKPKRPPSMLSERWLVSVHESGHLIAAAVLLKDTGGAAVVVANGGQAFIEITDPLENFDQAIAVAAGPASEYLAKIYSPTAEAKPVPVVSETAPACQSSHATITSSIGRGTPDAERIAVWCLRGCSTEPQRWAQRHAWLYREAGRFVANNETRIIEIARRLFADGIVFLNRLTLGENHE